MTRERQLPVEQTAYTYAIRQALRRERGFYRKGAKVLALTLPKDAEVGQYAAAAKAVLKTTDLLKGFIVCRPLQGRRGTTDWSEVEATLSESGSVLILLPYGEKLPQHLAAAVDCLAEVSPVTAYHLAAAIKVVHKQSVTLEQAQQLLAYPLSAALLAIRRDRPVDVTLAKLKESIPAGKPAAATREAPLLEELSGYGKAKEWGIDLATDLQSWQRGEIEWVDVDCGILLSGPPGTGKTLFASALARTCRAHFIPTSLAQWQSKGHLGDLLGAMRKSFSEAALKAPSILFIDEFDSLGDRSRFSGHNEHYCREVVNGLLECLDGTDRREGVVVVGACNDASAIDPALLRSGRLDRHVRIDLPDLESRKGIVSVHFGASLTDEEVARVALETDGFSGADIAKLARGARRLARRSGRTLTADDVVAVLPPFAPIEGDERRAVAIHEAGHAVVGLELGLGVLHGVVVAKKVRADRSAASGGTHFQRRPGKDAVIYRDELAMTLGGRAAESVLLGTFRDGSGGVAGSDLQQAADLATCMECQLGMGAGLTHYSAATSSDLEKLRRDNPMISRRVERLLVQEHERAQSIIIRRRRAVQAIADELFERGTLDGPTVMRLMEELPPDDEPRRR